MAKSAKKTQAKSEVSFWGKLLDEAESKFDLGGGDAARLKLSTNCLVLDFILGGGLSYGMTTFSGKEGASKSTLQLGSLRSAMEHKIPLIYHFDGEGTAQADIDYTQNNFRVKSLDEVYGQKVDNVWIKPRKIAYADSTILEHMFSGIKYVLDHMPDKVFSRDRDKWFYRVDKNNKKQARFLQLGTSDPKLSDANFSYIPTDNPYPQAMVAIDSYPVYLPERMDEKEDSSAAMASQATAYSSELRRVVGKLRRKQLIICGINQIREKPAQMFGNPEYEPCGNALKFYSRSRCNIASLYVPEQWQTPKNKQVRSEQSLDEKGGEDSYAYKRIKNVKNKNGTPWLEGWTRIWVKDAYGKGRGVDPVFDTAEFLRMIGLLKIKGKDCKITFSKSIKDLPLAGKELSWLEFKALILAEDFGFENNVALAGKLWQKHNGGKKINLRKWCFALMESGNAHKLYFEHIINSKDKSND